MEKKILLLLSIFVIVPQVNVLAASSPIDGFRDFEWGTSKENIEKSVITDDMIRDQDYTYSEDEDFNYISLRMSGTVSDFDAAVEYIFQNDCLVGGSYVLQEDHLNLSDYYDDYCSLVDLYTEIYGEPYSSEENWIDDSYKEDADSFTIGVYICFGFVNFSTHWLDDSNNQISVAVSSDDLNISTRSYYYSSAFINSLESSLSESNTDGI